MAVPTSGTASTSTAVRSQVGDVHQSRCWIPNSGSGGCLYQSSSITPTTIASDTPCSPNLAAHITLLRGSLAPPSRDLLPSVSRPGRSIDRAIAHILPSSSAGKPANSLASSSPVA